MSDRLSNVIVQGTLGLLILFSVVTWTLVIAKGIQVARARRQDRKLASALGTWQGLPTEAAIGERDGPSARVALAGVKAWREAGAGAGGHVATARGILELTFRRQIQRERRSTEAGLAVLASIGTTAPFVGLFGTVWGIMHALKSIGEHGSASLDVVAGPIGEALIATGIGIAVAVPAVLAFNFFVRRLKEQAADLEELATVFIAAALRGTLPEGPAHVSAEHSVSKLEPRPSLREARV